MKKLLVCAVFFTSVIFGSVTAFGDEPSAGEMQPDSLSGNDYFVTVKYAGEADKRCFSFESNGDFLGTDGWSGTWEELSLGPLAFWKLEASDNSGNPLNMRGFQFLSRIRGRGDYLYEGVDSVVITAKGQLAADNECSQR